MELLGTPASQLTRQEREQVREAARERILLGKSSVAESMDALGSVIDMTREELLAYHRDRSGDSGYLVGTYEDRQALVTANKDLGRDVFRAVDCTVQDRLEEACLDDANVVAELNRRIEKHPEMIAYNRALAAYTEDEDRAAREGGLTIRQRLHAESWGDTDKPGYTPVTDEELRAFILKAHGEEGLSDKTIGPILQRYRKNRVTDLDYEVSMATTALERARRWGDSDEEVSRLKIRLAEKEKERDDYSPDLEAVWPIDATERKHLLDNLNSKVSGGQYIKHTIQNEVNEERREIQRQALVEELRRVQKFGGQTIEPVATGGKVTKALRADFDACTDLFPADMVAQAKDRHPSLVLRQTSRRAHFSSNRAQSWSEKTDLFVTLPSIDVEPEDAFASEISYCHTEEGVAASGYPATDKNRARMEAIAKAHNEGRTNMGAKPERSRKRRVLVVAEVPDEDGTPRLTLKAKNQVSQKVYGHAAELTTNGSTSTTLHELAHMMESDPRVFYACKQFLADRTTGKDSIVYNKSRRHGTEMAVPDGFANTYIGKDYAGSPHTEVFSMGMEGIFAQGKGGCRGINEMRTVSPNGLVEYEGVIDTDHRDLILGILAGYTSDGVMTKQRAHEVSTNRRRRLEEASLAKRERERERENEMTPASPSTGSTK